MEDGAIGKRGGRPTKPAMPGKKTKLGLLVTPETKTLLDGAREKGRTQAEEAERLIEVGKQTERLFSSAALRTLAVLQILAGLVAFETEGEDWLSDPDLFSGVLNRWFDELERLRPKPSVKSAQRVERVRAALARLKDDEPADIHRRRIAACEHYANATILPLRIRIEAEIATRDAWAKLESLIPARDGKGKD